MATLTETAKEYTPKQTLNIADLEEVSVDLETLDDEFEVEETKDGQTTTKVVKQKVIEVEGKRYRVPNSVLNQLKVLIEDNPSMKKFKVKKSGQGLNTEYIVIPIVKQN